MLVEILHHNYLAGYVAGEHFTEASIDHTKIQNIGTNAHSVIDTHLANTDKHIERAEWLVNGFENKTDSEMTFSDTSPDRTFSIQPTDTSFDYWVQGVKYTSTGDTLQISDDEGVHVIYYDDDNLSEAVNPNAGGIDVVIRTKAIVAILYWDVSASTTIYFGEERHGKIMSANTHAYLHFTEGLRYLNGLGLSSFSVDGNFNGNAAEDAAHAQFAVDAGAVTDEDLYEAISAVGSTTGLPIYYMLGADAEWQRDAENGYACRTYSGDNTTRLAYNEYTGGAWQLTEESARDFVLYHIFATTDKDTPMISIMGQNGYVNKNAARTGALSEIKELVTNDILFPEIKPIATIIYQTNMTYDNAVRARIVTTDEGDDYIDWRSETISRAEISTSDHNSLTGLQGGATSDYFHLLETEHAELTNWLDNVTLDTDGSVDLGSGVLTTTSHGTFGGLQVGGNGNSFSGTNSGWGGYNTFSGYYSGGGGYNTFSGPNSGWGYFNTFSGPNSGWGCYNTFSGSYSGWGYNNTSKAYQAVFGRYATEQGSNDGWVLTDDLFKVGIGTGSSARADAFVILKDGNVHIPNDDVFLKFGQGLDASIGWNTSDGGYLEIDSAAGVLPIGVNSSNIVIDPAGGYGNGSLRINQVADSKGLELYGFDDHATSYLRISINQFGATVFQTSGTSFFSSIGVLDNNSFRIGGSSNYRWIYNTSPNPNQLELWTSDSDGSGGDALVLRVQDGGVLVDFSGGAAFAGDIQLATGKTLKVNNTQVVAGQQAAVSDAVTQTLTGSDTVDITKLEADLTSCKNTINTLIDRLQAHGLIAT